jgi:putative endonuclease
MSEEKRYYVYIMASRSLTLYTGVTGDIYHRALQHKTGEVEGFTKRYHINRLVYYETFKYVDNAIAREKQIKAWTRAKRLALIKSENPTWQDLAESWGEPINLQIPRSQNQGRLGNTQPVPVARDDNSESVAEGWGEPIKLQIPRSQNQGRIGNTQPVPVARDDNSER